MYLDVISRIEGQGSDGSGVMVQSVHHLPRAEADHLHMAATANKQPPTHIYSKIMTNLEL